MRSVSSVFFLVPVVLALLVTALISRVSGADTIWEINKLLNTIEQSGCIFIRNGTEHTAAEARDHIQKKYKYVRSHVMTAEDFIRLAATESSITGKPYRTRCNGHEMFTKEWLTKKLDALRNGNREH
jgi:hypothetical protein